MKYNYSNYVVDKITHITVLLFLCEPLCENQPYSRGE